MSHATNHPAQRNVMSKRGMLFRLGSLLLMLVFFACEEERDEHQTADLEADSDAGSDTDTDPDTDRGAVGYCATYCDAMKKCGTDVGRFEDDYDSRADCNAQCIANAKEIDNECPLEYLTYYTCVYREYSKDCEEFEDAMEDCGAVSDCG